MTCNACAKQIVDGTLVCPHCRAPQRAVPAHFGPGTQVDRGDSRIVVEKKIGSGAMGNVYMGWLFFAPTGPRANAPPELVALKQLKREVQSQQEIRALFANEANALGLLNHPNVVRFIDLFEWSPPPARAHTEAMPAISIAPRKQGSLTLVMEFVEGASLDEVIARNVARSRVANVIGGLHPPRAFQYFEQLLGALSAAHARGIVHRDVKPSNTMIRKDGLVKLTDFGIAYFRKPDGEDESSSLAPGTGAYMSPEQVMGKALDARSDLYSAAIVLYEMLAGRAPFVPGEKSELSIRVDQVETTPPFISQVWPRAPVPLDAFFARALAKSPNARFQNEGELVEAAARALGLSPSPSWRRQAEFAHAAKGATIANEAQLRVLRGQVENGYRTQAITATR